MSQPAIAIEDFSVRFGGQAVLSHVSASLPAGGCTVFVGPNGAGKTTLLLCLLGEIKGTGTIRMAEGLAGHVGYVPQNLSFDVRTPVTVGEFLALGLTRRPLWLRVPGAARRQADVVLGQVGMEGAARRSLGDLSGGELRRILLASALLREPKLLLLDEPAAGVDLRGEHLFWDILGEARRERGMTIVMVSHNLPLTAHYATHVLCLHNGGCIEGVPHEVLTARNLMAIFGIPIHLYPDQCATPQFRCPQCGAFAPEDDCPALQILGRTAAADDARPQTAPCACGHDHGHGHVHDDACGKEACRD